MQVAQEINMITQKEYEKFERIGVEKPRCYYIPFSQTQKFAYRHKILNRSASDRFISLDGVWRIKEHKNLESVCLDEKLKIKLGECVEKIT